MANPESDRFLAAMLLFCLGCIGPAQADSLADPTRPPAEWLAAQPALPGSPVAGGDAAPGLRVLLIGPSRKFAVIDGQMVRLGGTYSGAKLVGIDPGGIVMQKDGNKQKLSMSPAVEKKFQVVKPGVGKLKSGKKVVNGEGQ